MNSQGRIELVCVAREACAPMQIVSEARAVPGHGLEGDRYFHRTGTFWKPLPDYEVTLVESEGIEAVVRDGVQITATDTRRNLVTRGVALNELIGREFQVGDVRLRGVRECPPCAHLARLLRLRDFSPLVGRGGLRAQVLQEGVVRPGDLVKVLA